MCDYVHAVWCVCMCVWVDRVIGFVNEHGCVRLQYTYSAVLHSAVGVWESHHRGNLARMRKLQTDRPNGCAEGRGCRANSC